MPQQPPKKSCDDIGLEHICDLLLDLKKTLDTHITEENIYKPKVVELVDILDKSKGVVWFIKVLSVVAVAGWGLVYWIRDHIKM